MSATSIATVLVQGASRGIGLQFCRTLLSRQPNTCVIATCRNPNQADDLQKLLADEPERLQVLQVDVTEEAKIKAAAEEVGKRHGRLDLLINCAGVLHPSGRGETSLRDVNMQGLMETCRTIAFGPLLMGKHFGQLLTKGTAMFGTHQPDCKRTHSGIMANISAKVGSITDNGLGGWYSYRMSKAALNMATKNLSIELGRGRTPVICVSLHPGTVDTDLSRPYHKNVKSLFTTEDSVKKLLSVVDSLTVDDTGKFFTYNKELLPF
ncbi:C-factor-like [Mya arenaria]|uniref:C-factor-like n=1 Tax=Mya arenaria TaxID=6604 RepID=UPI0022E7BF63|nr:C-factor-like [Mya arenaria]